MGMLRPPVPPPKQLQHPQPLWDRDGVRCPKPGVPRRPHPPNPLKKQNPQT